MCGLHAGISETSNVRSACSYLYNVYHPGVVLQGQMEQTLGQIEICFNRAFQLTDCEEHEADAWGGLNDVLAYELDEWGGFGVCNSSMPVVYPPYKSAKQMGDRYLS